MRLARVSSVESSSLVQSVIETLSVSNSYVWFQLCAIFIVTIILNSRDSFRLVGFTDMRRAPRTSLDIVVSGNCYLNTDVIDGVKKENSIVRG